MLASQLALEGITVNRIAPISFLTDRTRSIATGVAERNGISLEEQLERNAKALPMGRYGDASEFAALCAFLCSAEAGYITGQTIVIDGGAGKTIF